MDIPDRRNACGVCQVTPCPRCVFKAITHSENSLTWVSSTTAFMCDKCEAMTLTELKTSYIKIDAKKSEQK